MPRIAGYRCTICGREFPFGPAPKTCPDCGEKGILDILYDYDEVGRALTRESLAACRDNSMWRYRALLPVGDGVDVSRFLRIGWSPLYRSLSLGRELGLRALYVKDDGINPTASLKDRASGVAVAKAIELAGGTYAFRDLKADENAQATTTLQMEAFYTGAKDADILIYNSTIEGELPTIDQLLDKSPLLADFQAVKAGNVWCTGKNLFQESLGLGDMMVDFHTIFTDPSVSDDALTYLHRLT